MSGDDLIMLALALAGAVGGAIVSVLLEASRADRLLRQDGRVNIFGGLSLLRWWSVPLLVTALVAPTVLFLMALLLGYPALGAVFFIGGALSLVVLSWRASSRTSRSGGDR